MSGPPSGSGVGKYAITPSGASNPNYDITFVDGIETITPAPLTIRPKDVTVASGRVPAYAWTGEGWANGDSDATLAKAPNKLPSCTAQAAGPTGPSAIAPGVYPGAITCSGAVDHNYDIGYTIRDADRRPDHQPGLPRPAGHRGAEGLPGPPSGRPAVVALQVRFGTRHTFHFPTVCSASVARRT